MPTLINCIECGKQVSSEARCCIHCGKDATGQECVICALRSRENSLVLFRDGRNSDYSSTYVHPQCVEEINQELKIPITCRVCRNTTTLGELKKGACPSCGQGLDNLYTSCEFCRGLILLNRALKIYVGSGHSWTHQACARN